MMKKVAYLCKTDYDYELGNASGGCKLYSSIEDLKKHLSCWEECGVLEVEVSVRNPFFEIVKAIDYEGDIGDIGNEIGIALNSIIKSQEDLNILFSGIRHGIELDQLNKRGLNN